MKANGEGGEAAAGAGGRAGRLRRAHKALESTAESHSAPGRGWRGGSFPREGPRAVLSPTLVPGVQLSIWKTLERIGRPRLPWRMGLPSVLRGRRFLKADHGFQGAAPLVAPARAGRRWGKWMRDSSFVTRVTW